MTTVLDVLAEPRRRLILDVLREGERLVGDIAHETGLSQPNASKHLKVLRDAGLVEVRVDAQRRWCSLRAEPFAELDAWLAPFRELWADRLDALAVHLDTMEEQ